MRKRFIKTTKVHKKHKNYQLINRGGFRTPSLSQETYTNVDIPTYMEITCDDDDNDEDNDDDDNNEDNNINYNLNRSKNKNNNNDHYKNNEDSDNDEKIEMELVRDHIERQTYYLNELIEYIKNQEINKKTRFIDICYYLFIFLLCFFVIWILVDYKIFNHNKQKVDELKL